MDSYTHTTNQDACTKAGVFETADKFYKMAFADAIRVNSAQFYVQLQVEQAWENARKPYYAVWPSIVPMLTRLNLDLDSSLIRLPLPALCIRFPKAKNPLVFDWKGAEVQIRCMMIGDEKYIDKAHRRGKVGWNVGRRMEVVPHYRRPHMALVWTGAGRTVPKVVPRRGSVVHREKVEKVPSGFGGG